MTIEAVPARRTLWLIAGFTVWGAAFVALYAMLSVGCALSWHEVGTIFGLTLQRLVLLILFAASLAGAGLVIVLTCARWIARRGDADAVSGFLAQTGYLASLAAFGSTLLTFLPVAFLTTCH